VDLYAILFQMILVEGNFFFVASDAVGLPHNQMVKGVLGRISKHELELLPVIVSARLCPVAVSWIMVNP